MYNVLLEVISNFIGLKYVFRIYMDLKCVEKNFDWFFLNVVING